MAYPVVIRYLNSFTNYEKNTSYSYTKDLKLARIQGFLSLLGNPQDSLRVIHIAGTKGKGSTCAFVAFILRESGYSVGLYSSPHLNDFRERIRILQPFVYNRKRVAGDFEGRISRQAVTSLIIKLEPVIERYNRNSKYGKLSLFEIYTAIAFLYFKQKNTDFAVLETGMGGRLDATNAAASLICGITPISLEHVQKLGNTMSKIAAEKSGIIKRNRQLVISACQDSLVRKVIDNRCRKFRSTLYEVGREIKYFKSKRGFVIQGLCKNYKNLRLRLLGEHQMANASLAVGLVEGINFYGFNIKEQAIRNGLYNTIWPGRCEVVGRNPLIILDGAQNVASAIVLRNAIKANFKYKKLILVLGVSDDKDISGICKILDPLANEIILTQAATSRATVSSRLSCYFKRKSYLTESVKNAKFLAGSLAQKNDLILVTGSLFVVGEFRNA